MLCSSWKQFPAGLYLINNGRKEEGGRFTVGTHAAVRRLFVPFPQVKFTTKMKDADYVILPDGIKEPGAKVLSRNTVLRNPTRYVWLGKVGHLMRATDYEVVEVKRGKTDERDKINIPKNIRLPDDVGPLFDPHVFLKMESHGTKDARVPRIAFGYKSDYDQDVRQMRALLTPIYHYLIEPNLGIIALLRTSTCVKKWLYDFQKYDDKRSTSKIEFKQLPSFIKPATEQEDFHLGSIYAEVKMLRTRLYQSAAALTSSESCNFDIRHDRSRSQWILPFHERSTISELVSAYFEYFHPNETITASMLAKAVGEPDPTEENSALWLRWSRNSNVLQMLIDAFAQDCKTFEENSVQENMMFVLTKAWCFDAEPEKAYLAKLEENHPQFLQAYAPEFYLFRWLNFVYEAMIRLNEEALSQLKDEIKTCIQPDRQACLLRWLRTLSDNDELFTNDQFFGSRQDLELDQASEEQTENLIRERSSMFDWLPKMTLWPSRPTVRR